MNKISLLLAILFSVMTNAQSGYDIKINLKNAKDSVAYLAYYQFDKRYIADTCKKIVNGNIVFKKNKQLDTGVYFLLSQDKRSFFDFIIDQKTQKQVINSDTNQIIEKLEAVNNSQNKNFFDYVRYVTATNKSFESFKNNISKQKPKDSIAQINNEFKLLDKKVKSKDSLLVVSNQGSFLSDMFNMKIEKLASKIPLATNGRPDSIFAYNYYKTHFWDGVNFEEDATMRNPFFGEKFKKYFNTVVVQHPDSLCVEIDRMMLKTKPNTMMNMLMLAFFAQTYESSKIMGMDKVFVHLVDNYFKTGKAKGIYEDATIDKIIERGNVLAPLLIGKPFPKLRLIDFEGQEKIKHLGFDTAKTSETLTELFFKNKAIIDENIITLDKYDADYFILVFWDVDCGHCQKEVPIIEAAYHKLIDAGKNVKVIGVYTQHHFDKYKKYVTDNKIDFINLYDGVRIHDFAKMYDVVTTPVIYILDKNKTIKAKKIGAESIEAIIAQLEK
jgi:hypothetical protein